MNRWLSIADRAARVAITALCLHAAGTTLAAQERSAVRVSSPSTPLLGPRLKPEWPRSESTVADTSASLRLWRASGDDRHGSTLSTLALVLIVIVVLLVVR